MTEYMDYNGFDDRKTKGQKIRSRLTMILSIAWLVFLVVWVFIRLPQNIRTDFEAISSSKHSVSEKASSADNKFLQLKSELDLGKTFTLSSDFKKQYSDIYSMLTLTKKELSQKPVKGFDSNGYFTLAAPFVVTETKSNESSETMRGVIGIDFLMVPYSTTGGVTISAPIRFSLRYDNSSDNAIPYIKGQDYSKKSFRLNFYSLSINLFSNENIKSVSYKANLLYPLTKPESENNKFSDNIKVKANEKLKSILISGEGISDSVIERKFDLSNVQTSATLKIEFDDLIYEKFGSIVVSSKDASEFSITAN